MAYTKAKKQEVLTLLGQGVGVNEVARITGVAVGTVVNWQKNSEAPSEGQIRPTEAEVSQLLLDKARNLLYSIDAESSAKAKSDVASAIDKLLARYANLVGKLQETHVTVHKAEDLDAALEALLRKEP